MALSLFAAAVSSAQNSKKDEDQLQTPAPLKELPLAVSGATRRLVFHVVPMSAKGLLTQQVRDALKTLAQETGKDAVLHIRAFVAGAGDVRRVRDLVSETFTSRKQPLPALSLIEAGGLSLPGAQVMLEAVSEARRDVNPWGLVFLSAQAATADDPSSPAAPLVAKSLARLGDVARAAGVAENDVVRVTCYMSSLDDLAAAGAQLRAVFPAAAADYVRPRRVPTEASAACEAVARLNQPSGGGMRLIDGAGPSGQSGESAAALLDSPWAVLTGTQESFGYEEKDARLALQRLSAALEQAGAAPGSVAYARYYALSSGIAAQLRKVRPGFLGAAHPPAGWLLLWEGAGSMDAGFAVDAVAAKN